MEDDNQTRITLRLPDDIRDRVASAAKQNNRSMNAEIIARLESSFSGGSDNASLLATLARLNLDLALSELEKQGLEAEAANLAFSLKQASELLLNPLDKPDETRQRLIKIFVEQASPHLETVNSLGLGLQARLDGVKDAVQELSQARANLVAAADVALESPSNHPAPAATEPPQRRLRMKQAGTRQEEAGEKVKIPELPEIKRGILKPKKKPEQ